MEAMNRRAQPWLGTIVEISIADVMAGHAIAAAYDLAFEQIALVHRLMAFHTPDSDLSRINRAPVGSHIAISRHTHAVLQAALQVSIASAGLFDIRVAGRLVEWEILPPLNQPPIPYVPLQTSFRLTAEGTVQKLSADYLDLGGIAKGYAVDLAIESLQQAGVQNACVNAGGDLRVMGNYANEVLLRNSNDPTNLAYRLVLQNQALATSASYFSLHQTGENRCCALVNGRTGEAMLNRISVSVSAPRCMFADALTKLVMASTNAAHPCLAQFCAQAFIT
jgi:thiamine biosynthesis lipoprotein